MSNLIELLGFASGVYLIKPDLEIHGLVATLAAIHLCDAVLCLVIARQGGRHRIGWPLAGLFLGVWAVLPLLLQRGRQGE